MNVEFHQIEQFFIAHLGQQEFRAAFQHILHQLQLRFDQLVNAVFYGATTNEFVHQHVPLLADAEGAVGGLIFHGGIPPAIEVDHMRSGGEVQPRAARLEREDEERRQFVFLKTLDQFTAFGDRSAAVQHQSITPEDGAEKRRQRLGGFAELREHQHLFLLRGDHLCQLAQAGEFAAVLRAPCAIAQPLRGGGCRFV